MPAGDYNFYEIIINFSRFRSCSQFYNANIIFFRSYVKKTEVLLLKTFSTYKNSEAAHRTTDHKFTKYCFAPVHLYGELAQMHEG